MGCVEGLGLRGEDLPGVLELEKDEGNARDVLESHSCVSYPKIGRLEIFQRDVQKKNVPLVDIITGQKAFFFVLVELGKVLGKEEG